MVLVAWGKKSASELARRKKEFVIIEKTEFPADQEDVYAYIQGDATEDNSLIKAGIERARGVVVCLRG